MPFITRAELDQAGCGTPNCEHDHSIIFLHGRCHMSSGMEIAYHKATGTLKIACKKCKTPVAEIAVAE